VNVAAVFCGTDEGETEVSEGPPAVMAKVTGAETAVPVCTVTVAVPTVASRPAGRIALIDVAEDEFKVSVVGPPPGGVKRTTGVPPALRLVPVMVKGLTVATFCSADAGLRFEITGSIT